MKDLRPELRTFLLADAALLAAVASRVYLIKLPQGTTADSIVYNRISGAGDYVMSGLSGFTQHRYQIDAWSQTGDGADTLANLIRDRLDGYKGTMGTIKVHGVRMVEQREDYDDTAKLYRVSRDFMIAFAEL